MHLAKCPHVGLLHLVTARCSMLSLLFHPSPDTCNCCACRDSVILVLETGYVFGWLVAMVLNLIIPHETGDPMERIRAARKAKGLVVPLSEEEGRAIEENQIHYPKMGFEGDSAHPQPVVVPVSYFTLHVFCCMHDLCCRYDTPVEGVA